MSTIQRVFILGAGKVGAGLARAARRAGLHVTLRPFRRGIPKKPLDADLVILALRDRELGPAAEALAASGVVRRERRVTAVVHCAGALRSDAIAALRGPGVAVAQMHPMISFASTTISPSLERGQLHVEGDRAACVAARAFGQKLGLTPRTVANLDPIAYHAAAGLVANGAAALAAGGVDLLERAGVDRKTAALMLGPLLRSVAENVERIGLPAALTGPIRRGDAAGVARHLALLERIAPHVVELYLAAGRLQLPLSAAIGDTTPEAVAAIALVLRAR